MLQHPFSIKGQGVYEHGKANERKPERKRVPQGTGRKLP